MRVEIEDLHRVVKLASKHHRRVVVGGHCSAARSPRRTRPDFHHKAGAAKLVAWSSSTKTGPHHGGCDDGIGELCAGTPWPCSALPAPFAGLFNPRARRMLHRPRRRPSGSVAAHSANQPPVPVNIAQYGYADAETSRALAAAQAHLGIAAPVTRAAGIRRARSPHSATRRCSRAGHRRPTPRGTTAAADARLASWPPATERGARRSRRARDSRTRPAAGPEDPPSAPWRTGSAAAAGVLASSRHRRRISR